MTKNRAMGMLLDPIKNRANSKSVLWEALLYRWIVYFTSEFNFDSLSMINGGIHFSFWLFGVVFILPRIMPFLPTGNRGITRIDTFGTFPGVTQIWSGKKQNIKILLFNNDFEKIHDQKLVVNFVVYT